MTLYTEEEVVRAIELSDGRSTDEVLAGLTPIKLPSDEEIKKMMELDGMEFDEFDPYDVSYLGGATWMRNKIQGDQQ
jgi:hypothetical protein